MPTPKQIEADRIDAELCKLCRLAEVEGFDDLYFALRRARNEARELMSEKQRADAPY